MTLRLGDQLVQVQVGGHVVVNSVLLSSRSVAPVEPRGVVATIAVALLERLTQRVRAVVAAPCSPASVRVRQRCAAGARTVGLVLRSVRVPRIALLRGLRRRRNHLVSRVVNHGPMIDLNPALTCGLLGHPVGVLGPRGTGHPLRVEVADPDDVVGVVLAGFVVRVGGRVRVRLELGVVGNAHSPNTGSAPLAACAGSARARAAGIVAITATDAMKRFFMLKRGVPAVILGSPLVVDCLTIPRVAERGRGDIRRPTGSITRFQDRRCEAVCPRRISGAELSCTRRAASVGTGWPDLQPRPPTPGRAVSPLL